jgi:hypothetical protein
MLRPVPEPPTTDETLATSEGAVPDEALVPRILAGETALFESSCAATTSDCTGPRGPS